MADIDLIVAMVDAYCRAWHPDMGHHYDSRCLAYNGDAIQRLIDAGLVEPIENLSASANEAIPEGYPPRILSSVVATTKQVPRPAVDSRFAQMHYENQQLRQRLADIEAANQSLPQPPPAPGANVAHDEGTPHGHQ